MVSLNTFLPAIHSLLLGAILGVDPLLSNAWREFALIHNIDTVVNPYLSVAHTTRTLQLLRQSQYKWKNYVFDTYSNNVIVMRRPGISWFGYPIYPGVVSLE